MIEIKLIKNVKLNRPYFIEGLPGLGLVGTVAATYLVQKLNMEYIGYVRSKDFPPLVAIHDYKPYYPIRIYYSKKYNLIAMLSEFIIPMNMVQEMSEALLAFIKKYKIRGVISLGSITIKGEQDTVYVITSEHKKLAKKIKDIPDVEIIKEGATTGVTAMLLAEGMMQKIPVISLLAEAHSEYVDPKGASMVLNVLNELLGMDINTKELDKEAKEIDRQMKNIIEKGKRVQKRYKEIEKGSLESMYQ